MGIVFCVAGFVMGNPGRGEAYRFNSLRGTAAIATAAEAIRWDATDFPLRFHLQDNIPEYLTEAQWREIVKDGFGVWSAIRTADVRLSLEPDLVEGDGADRADDLLTIGWIPDEAITFAGRSKRWSWLPTGRTSHCDIEMSLDYYRQALDADGLELEEFHGLMRETLAHEVGHCLGLRHTEPHPIPGWLSASEDPPPIPSGFLPDPMMSYGFARVAELTQDDEIAVSLLYPVPGFASSRGAISGRLLGEAGIVPFAYVQAVYPGYQPRMGPGAFANEDGYFHLEGLQPGTVTLWVHPILVHHTNAHGDLLAMAFDRSGLDTLDQWRWVRVPRGDTVGVTDIRLATGRR